MKLTTTSTINTEDAFEKNICQFNNQKIGTPDSTTFPYKQMERRVFQLDPTNTFDEQIFNTFPAKENAVYVLVDIYDIDDDKLNNCSHKFDITIDGNLIGSMSRFELTSLKNWDKTIQINNVAVAAGLKASLVILIGYK